MKAYWIILLMIQIHNTKQKYIATLDEAMTMGQKGMDTEKIIEVLKSTSRTKQASGGLSYLMGM